MNHGQMHMDGIIPAYAGSTWLEDPIGVIIEDHPRVCGEHGQFLAVNFAM